MSLRPCAASAIAATRNYIEGVGLWTTLLFAPTVLAAQAEYFNLDAGRPTRVEDALATERYSLELLPGGFRLDQLSGGVRRWRAEPKVVFGILPFTELEVRVPVVRSASPTPGVRGATGAAGIGIGALHAFNIETYRLPALALSSEVLLPGAAPFGAPRATYSVKALVTRTTRVARFHLNAAAGTYSVRGAAPADTAAPTCTFVYVGGTCANGRPVPVPIDLPCLRDGPSSTTDDDAGATSAVTASSATAASASAPSSPTRPSINGKRWMVGVGADRSVPLRSLLITGDIFAERFQGLYRLTDWTAELGARHQLTPQLIVDFGIARHFAGTVLSSSGSIGLTWAVPTRGWLDDDK